MHSAVVHSDTWKVYDREPVTFDGVDCCLYVYVDEFNKGEIRVELIPEDEGRKRPLAARRFTAAEDYAAGDIHSTESEPCLSAEKTREG
jgi:hypothetical protein